MVRISDNHIKIDIKRLATIFLERWILCVLFISVCVAGMLFATKTFPGMKKTTKYHSEISVVLYDKFLIAGNADVQATKAINDSLHDLAKGKDYAYNVSVRNGVIIIKATGETPEDVQKRLLWLRDEFYARHGHYIKHFKDRTMEMVKNDYCNAGNSLRRIFREKNYLIESVENYVPGQDKAVDDAYFDYMEKKAAYTLVCNRTAGRGMVDFSEPSVPVLEKDKTRQAVGMGVVLGLILSLCYVLWIYIKHDFIYTE